jgi:imidazolonepropionase-like amidohydrolase
MSYGYQEHVSNDAACNSPGPRSSRDAEQSGSRYRSLTLIDPVKETSTGNSYILVTDGRIAATGVGAPPISSKPDRVMDLAGRYALPGFVDAHAHITGAPPEFKVVDGKLSVTMASDDRLTQHSGRIALAFGVTTVRNPGGDPEANARYDRMIATGQWLGPEAVHAGSVIEPPPFGGASFTYPRTETQWQAEAARQAKLGMRYFKLYVSLSEAELATGIRVAHQHGLQAIAHLNKVSWARAAKLGIDGLEHALPTSPDLLEPAQRSQYLAELGPDSKFMYRWFERADYDGPLMRRLVDLLAQKQVVTNMTFFVNHLVYNIDDPKRALPNMEMYRRYSYPGTLETAIKQLQASNAGWTPGDYARARAVMPKVLKFGALLHQAGVPMMIGTDGTGGGPYYATELALHRQAGIPAWAILRMATSGATRILGIGNRTGRIEPGLEADVVFLTADPVADIANAAKVYGVLNNGQLHPFANLTEDARKLAEREGIEASIPAL